jgi:hypothetical protein
MNNHKRAIVLFVASMIVLLVAACNGSPGNPTPVSNLDNSFSYPVRVQTSTGIDIPNANVTIDVAQKAPLNDVTDSTGYARIFIDSSYIGKPGKLIVDVDGYERFIQNIDLIDGTLPDVIQLKLIPPTPTMTYTPSPLPPPTNTPQPTATNTPQPIPIPTDTPIPSTDIQPTIGQNCNLQPGGTFASVWQEYHSVLGCPINNQITIPLIAEEAFQGGHLLWRSDTDDVYVIYDRQKTNAVELWEGRWTTDPTWDWAAVGEPDPDGIGLSPPPGLVEPKRGFGWLWRTFLGRENGQLGWALDKEYGFENTGQVQNFENGVMVKGASSKKYALFNDGRFIAR